jgi:hypothetical protein
LAWPPCRSRDGQLGASCPPSPTPPALLDRRRR